MSSLLKSEMTDDCEDRRTATLTPPPPPLPLALPPTPLEDLPTGLEDVRAVTRATEDRLVSKALALASTSKSSEAVDATRLASDLMPPL